MPLVIHPRIGKHLRRVAALTALALTGSTGVAAAACPAQPLTKPFSQWGDTNDYFVMPGGHFEGGAPAGWTLTNSALTAGNEPWKVRAATDTQSLTIKAGGSATTAPICVDHTMPSFRVFAREVTPGTALVFELLWKGSNGKIAVQDVSDLSSGSMPTWQPSQPLTLFAALPITLGETLSVQLRFRAPNTKGSWQIDDVFIDPFRSN